MTQICRSWAKDTVYLRRCEVQVKGRETEKRPQGANGAQLLQSSPDEEREGKSSIFSSEDPESLNKLMERR